MTDVIFDIETGPLPIEQIKHLYTPPPPLPPFDESMVKYGNMKDPSKRADKLAQVRAEYELQLANEQQSRDADYAEWLGKAALSPITGEVLAIGILVDGRKYVLGQEGETEAEMLSAFWKFYKKKNAESVRFIGFCSNMFDFSFIVWRSYFHSVGVPESAWDKTGRNPAYAFVDLIDRLPKRGFEIESRKLGDVCEWLGLGSKPEGVDGGMFAALWRGNAESRAQAVHYLCNDLEMTKNLAQRMGV
jgi:hypothetical protein